MLTAAGSFSSPDPPAAGALPDHERVFSGYYERGEWGAERMDGSRLDTTTGYRSFIEQFIVEHGIRSVLDAGCGEWGFASAIDWKGARCKGLDISGSVIARNRALFPDVAFEQADLRDLSPHTGFDLLIVKDVLQHWSLACIRGFLAQPALAAFRHVLLVNCDDEAPANRDIPEGDWRPLNLLAPDLALPTARAVRRFGTKRIVHLGPRLELRNLLERFEWWIVNLDRRADRLVHARGQLARLGVHRPWRFQAFDGRRLGLASRRPDWVRPGAVGCYLSHLALLKQAQARRQPCVVLEDDLLLAPDFEPAFEAFLQEVPEDWDVLLLSGGQHFRPPQPMGQHHSRLVGTWGTHMVILRLPAIDRLLEAADDLDRPIDDFYSRMMGELKFYAPSRQLVTQESLGSNVGEPG